jgi:polysaccharide pyruvyl transferase WcaK-like protein
MNNKIKPKVLILGTGSLLNYGCEGIVRGTYNMFQEFWPDTELIVASDDLEYDRNLFKDCENISFINYKKRFTPYRLIMGGLRRMGLGKETPVRMESEIAKGYDIFLSVGGDNYMEKPGGGIYLILEDLITIGNNAKKFNVLFAIWGVSIGKFGRDSISKVEKNLNNADLLFPRESISYSNIINMNVNKNKVMLVADPAFYMDYDKTITLKRSNENEVLIGVNISLLSVKHSFDDEEKGIKKMFASLDSLLEENDNYRFLCIPHVMSDNGGPQDDHAFMSSYIEQSPYKNRLSILDKKLGGRITKGYIAQCDMIIAARMHCCVAGISSGTPTLFLTYSHKGVGMARYAYGNDDLILDVKSISKERLSKKVKFTLDSLIDVRNQLQNKNKIFKKDASKSIIRLKEQFEK